ncbi:MAG: endonuclease/exonuclease/phosphatase family protein [Bacteroidales bacterium]|nr:endonuclease/exonuclease/phosphatase family protein [Bacteroidales bacterium]
MDRYYQLNGRAKPANIANSIKVMSYNVQLFGLYSSSHHAEQLRVRDAEMSFLRAQQPDILCLQEYFYDKTGTLDFNTRDSLLSLMGLSRKSSKEQSNYYVTLFPASTRNNYQAGEAIFSKYKIVRSGAVPLPDTNTYNGSLFADIKYKHDTIRVYCIHLESFKMSEADYEIGKEWSEGNFNDPAFNKKAYHLSEKVAVASRERAKQVKMIRAHVKQSPYPVIICGDFNDTPVSYSYYQLCRGLDDSFRRSGKGAGITYRGDAFPNYRIDYILHSSKYNAYEHTVCTSIATSDHFPVYTYLSLKKR